MIKKLIKRTILTVGLSSILAIGIGEYSANIPVVVYATEANAFIINDGVLEKYSGDEKQVVIPGNVNEIAAYAFSGCSSIEKITIPDNVTKIGKYAFKDCSSLKDINVPSTINRIEIGTFFGCSSLENVVLPSGITYLGDNAFQDCTSLAKISLPEQLTYLGGEAFKDCKSLKSLYVPAKVNNIGYGAVNGCDELMSIKVDKNNTEFDSRQNCQAIIRTSNNYLIESCKNTFIPEGIQGIATYAFLDNRNIKSIDIPDSVIDIGVSSFNGCESLEEIYIPSSVMMIRNNAFANCSGLTKIVVDPDNASYDSRDNCNAIVMKKNNKIITGCVNTTFPSSVKTIGENAFEGCSLLKRITIPSTIDTVCNNAFEKCINLLMVDCQAGEIGSFAFSGSGLQMIYIGDSVNKISDTAFAETSLTDIYTVNYSYSLSTTIDLNYVGVEPKIHYGQKMPCTEHESVIDEAVEPSENIHGLTEGSHCVFCGEIIIEQKVVHYASVTKEAKEPSEDEHGCTAEIMCSVCKCMLQQSTVAHNIVVDEAKEATEDENGCTEGKHCTVCNLIEVEQEILPRKGLHLKIYSKNQRAVYEYEVYKGNKFSFASGERMTFSVIYGPDIPEKEYTIKWSSSNPDVGYVDESGYVITRRAGTTVISAEIEGGYRAECEIEVLDSYSYSMGHRYVDVEALVKYIDENGIDVTNMDNTKAITGEQNKYIASISHYKGSNVLLFTFLDTEYDATLYFYYDIERLIVTSRMNYKQPVFNCNAYADFDSRNNSGAKLQFFGLGKSSSEIANNYVKLFLDIVNKKILNPLGISLGNMNFAYSEIIISSNHHRTQMIEVVEPSEDNTKGHYTIYCPICNYMKEGDINPAKEITIPKNEYIYDGSEIAPEVVVVDSEGITIEDTEYEIEYKNNINCGIATIVVNFKGKHYKGQLTKAFYIRRYVDSSLINPFLDLPANAYYTEGIIYVNMRGAMTGFTTTKFGINEVLSRQSMVTLLWKNEGSPEWKTDDMPFTDVSKGAFYDQAIAWARYYGITTGKSADTFGVGEDVTRQDFIVFLYRYAQFKGYDVSVKNKKAYMEKTDYNEVYKYAIQAVNWGVENGFIGYNRPDMMPRVSIKRKDAALIIARFIKKYDETTDYYYTDYTDYSISYILDGGVNNKNNPTIYQTASDDIILGEAFKVNALFMGWYSDKELTKKVTKIEKGSYGNITLYAKWQSHTYTKSEALKKLYNYINTYGEEIRESKYIQYEITPGVCYYRIAIDNSDYPMFVFSYYDKDTETSVDFDYGLTGYNSIDVDYDVFYSQNIYASYRCYLYTNEVCPKVIKESLYGRGYGLSFDTWDEYAYFGVHNLFMFSNRLLIDTVGLTIQDIGFTSWTLDED